MTERKRQSFKAWLKCFIPLVLVIVLAAPLMAFLGDSPGGRGGRVTVMTRNLYVGASFSSLVGVSTPDEIPERVARVYARILSSQFQRRAEAIANEIVQAQPDVVGLQEATLLLVQSRSELPGTDPHQPAAVAIDYLQILLDALQSRGAHA
jgi:hypothetical protein